MIQQSMQSRVMESEVEATELLGQVDPSTLESQVKPSLAGHGWKQRGIEVICTTCPLTHGFYVKPNLMLTGIDENGEPVFKKRF